jgi:hypothetical protein
MSRRRRCGEKTIQSTASPPPIAPITIVSRNPTHVASAPPTSVPSGIVPQTRKRITEFIRPCRRGGQIACR